MISGQAVPESRFIKNRTGAGPIHGTRPHSCLAEAAFFADGWFTIEIIAEGKKATIKVDGNHGGANDSGIA